MNLFKMHLYKKCLLINISNEKIYEKYEKDWETNNKNDKASFEKISFLQQAKNV